MAAEELEGEFDVVMVRAAIAVLRASREPLLAAFAELRGQHAMQRHAEQASPMITASPVACDTCSSSQRVPSAPMLSSLPAGVSTTSPGQASRCAAKAAMLAAIPPFMSAAPRPQRRPASIAPAVSRLHRDGSSTG